MAPRAGFTPLHLTTEVEAPHRRAELAREVFGRQILRMEVEPVRGETLGIDLKLWNLPGLKMVYGVVTGAETPRTRSLLSDGNDDLFISMSLSGRLVARQRGEQVVMERGAIHVGSNAEPLFYTHLGSHAIGLLAPRAAIAQLVPGLDDRVARPLPQNPDGLRRLRGYALALSTSAALSEPGVVGAAATHVHDLIGLVLGLGRDARETVAGRGLKAARMMAVKAHIARHLGSGDLSVGAVALAQQLTPRYVQRLFEDEGTTFSSHVLGERLALARRLLGDPGVGKRTISAIAYGCGFGDLSHFNHNFRRRYGVTPSDVRAGEAA
jgi:AraC-like DNA-binding protein